MYNWEHADFISIYAQIKEVKDYVKLLDEGVEFDQYHAKCLVYNCMWFHYRMYQDTYIQLTEEELAAVEEYRDYSEEIFYNRLKFTDEEADQLYEEALEHDVLRVKICYDYAEQIWERIE